MTDVGRNSSSHKDSGSGGRGEDGGDGDDDHLSDQVKAMMKTEFSRPEIVNHCAVPVVVENLCVRRDAEGSGGDSSSMELAPNFASAMLGRWLASRLGLGGAKPSPPERAPTTQRQEHASSSSTAASDKYVVSGVDALLLPGEATLLLGPSSSGKTTLLQSISDAMRGRLNDQNSCSNAVEGQVRLGSIDPAEWVEEYTDNKSHSLARITAFVDQGDLSLTPILTVEETVQFARWCAEGQFEYTEESIDAMLQLLELDHVRATVVGNSDIRGVSGGQKRRVKVLEMAVGMDVFCLFLDEPTNGLDAASALSLTKVLVTALRGMRCAAVVSLLQPSTEVYEQFDRLILLTSHGTVAYSGRADLALAHFERTLGLTKPPDMNAPEFLLRAIDTPQDFTSGENNCLNYNLKFGDSEVIEVGEWQGIVTPSGTPATIDRSFDFAKAFRESLAGQDLRNEIQGTKDEHTDTALPRLSDWAVSTRKQIQLLMGRGWKLVVRNPSSGLRIATSIIFGAFIGTLFLNTPDDDDGTFTRAGYLLTMLFLSFLNSSMAPLEDLFHDRNTFYIHRRAVVRVFRHCAAMLRSLSHIMNSFLLGSINRIGSSSQ